MPQRLLFTALQVRSASAFNGHLLVDLTIQRFNISTTCRQRMIFGKEWP
jgi:hypothetical protein